MNKNEFHCYINFISNTNRIFGITLSKLNVGKKYHSGKISKGVANGLEGSPKAEGSKIAKPTQHAIVPKIDTGNIYNKSFGQAGLN